jgi:hypothetical protein
MTIQHGHEHTAEGACLMADLPIGGMGEGDQRPQGICDGCGQLVTGAGRAPAVIEVQPGTGIEGLILAILNAGERGVILRRCPVCGMPR